MSTRKGRFAVAALISVFAAVALTLAAEAQTFTKIADLNTPIPGGTGAFTDFTQPQVSQGNIVFGGGGANNQAGIYRFNRGTSSLATIVDGNTVLPGTP